MTRCRICASTNLITAAHYDALPVAGTYVTAEEFGTEPLLPLTAVYCADCGLLQLVEVLPDEVYRQYRYVGTVSASYRTHLERSAQTLVDDWGMRNKRVVEIGCADGYFLRQMRERGGNQVFGYEPADQARAICVNENHIPATGSFFAAETLSECPLFPADAILFRHVLEHIDDLNGFMAAVSGALTPTGIVVIEVPDLGSILRQSLYFHFYHEHLSYFALGSLERLLARHGLIVADSRIVDIHSGSLYVICRKGQAQAFTDAPALADVRQFFDAVSDYAAGLRSFVADQRAAGLRIAGYGAAHRSVVALSLARLEGIDYLVDKNPHLHGLYTPGSHLPIYPPERLHVDQPDALILFASSFEDEIMREQRDQYHGRFISILPTPRFLP